MHWFMVYLSISIVILIIRWIYQHAIAAPWCPKHKRICEPEIDIDGNVQGYYCPLCGKVDQT